MRGFKHRNLSVLSSTNCRILCALLTACHRFSFSHIALLCSISRASQDVKIATQSRVICH